MWLLHLMILGCSSGKDSGEWIGDTGDTPPLQNVDADGDGYPRWDTTDDAVIADCNDSDPLITPEVERYIPAGTFLRGSQLMLDTTPERQIYLSDYCMDVYEVSNDHFAAFLIAQSEMGLENVTEEGLPLFDFEDDDDIFPERIEVDADLGYRSQAGYENHPVTEVWQWSGTAFCEWGGKRLPTEAEWEKGARGTDARTYPWGEEEPTCDIANYGTVEVRCIGDTVDVGSYPDGVSPYGLHDMSGNVAEFVLDWYGSSYYADAPDTDPMGPESGDVVQDMQGNTFEAIIARSGNHATGPRDLRTFARTAEPAEATSNGVGFRCARPLE